MSNGEDIATEIRRLLRILLVATVILYFIVIGAVVWSWFDTRSRTDRTNAALCALRHDLEQRVITSQQFLVDHPNGVAQIPAKVIQDQINGQIRTIKSLRTLDCRPLG